ncbi:sulfurtransferase [Robbsia andropogonis]|uniref:sulfurtransferase n=1 Tax=Robbsia andropogonis TaxID=28092 RepID=UPI000462FEBA|nr:sulfurtransferase [Robbsia andropogonis]
MRTVNLAGYLFVSIPDPAAWRAPLRERCDALQLRGTILLSPEGINLFIAGAQPQTDALIGYLRDDPLFEGRLTPLTFKTSLSEHPPFGKMRVKLKREIITMRHPTIRPEAGRAPSVSPETLRTWLDRGHDDNGRPVVLLDTRNGFEIDHGTFEGAIDWRLEKFGDFPDAVETHRDTFDGKTVVSFCTGGIRCEKAAIHMANNGINDVYQLEGGILGYFEHVGGAHYNGACFVFDEREALTPALQPVSRAAATSDAFEQ